MAALAAVGCGSETYTVTSIDDSGAGSLREAIALANSGDTIDFVVTGTITLTSGELVIEKELNIQGPGADELTLGANLTSRVFAIKSGGNVAISGVTISDASNSGVGGAIINIGILTLTDSVVSGSVAGQDGGGIYNSGKLTLVNTAVTGNEATGESGGIGEGGGIGNSGDLTLTGTTINNNQ